MTSDNYSILILVHTRLYVFSFVLVNNIQMFDMWCDIRLGYRNPNYFNCKRAFVLWLNLCWICTTVFFTVRLYKYILCRGDPLLIRDSFPTPTWSVLLLRFRVHLRRTSFVSRELELGFTAHGLQCKSF